MKKLEDMTLEELDAYSIELTNERKEFKNVKERKDTIRKKQLEVLKFIEVRQREQAEERARDPKIRAKAQKVQVR